ncbi:hypothetical protein RJ639_044602 [Escallonia herrerae]|uniref:Protein downstream neighbor of Son n=1 Tax=Escallonia herrerae TaxID=1293975 RepID=A0AA88WF21_9ASTE|nr:hypothetical protein RJ639_044602 [Escallonia herrerae]
MAKVATAGPSLSNPPCFSGGGASTTTVTTALKRKTPSELRGEQLKRKNVVELVDESPASLSGPGRYTNGGTYGTKKPDISKNPRYIDTRVDELFPARKSFSLRFLSGKVNAKEHVSMEHAASLSNSAVLSDVGAESQPEVPCLQDSAASVEVSQDRTTTQTYNPAKKCSESTFRTVKELSLSGEKLSGLSVVDMDKALKGLVAREPPTVSASRAELSERNGDFAQEMFCSEFYTPCRKIPLDFTLKSTMRVLSSSSVNCVFWSALIRFHRLITCGNINVMDQFKPQLGFSLDQDTTTSPELTSTSHLSNRRALYSWVYPQSSLPPVIISTLTSSAVEGGQMDFLRKRQSAWDDAFRSLYYMLRKNVCNIFYVCTAQFVVVFTGGNGCKEEAKRMCNAYISQSTRGLRSLLKEHGVCFSMPLCRSKEEQVTTEDLVELSEIEKHNLGQTRRLGSLSDVDNSPESLLAFIGNRSVHGLYDFLLNYRVILASLTGVDVPVLYSPVPFENAGLSAPEVRCKEVRRADRTLFPSKESDTIGEPKQGSSPGFCFSIEIKDAYLPPWIICNACDALSSDGSSFEARYDSFMTQPTSVGLNAGLDNVIEKSNLEATAVEGSQGRSCLDIPNALFSSRLRNASIKGLKYCNGSYTVSLSSI